MLMAMNWLIKQIYYVFNSKNNNNIIAKAIVNIFLNNVCKFAGLFLSSSLD